MLPYQELKNSIKEKGYISIPVHISKDEFETAISSFFSFLALPLEVKKEIYLKLRPNERGSEVGYMRYLKSEGKTDDREYFHYHEFAEKSFLEKRKEIKELDELLRNMKFIYDKAVEVLDVIAEPFEKEFPGFCDKLFLKNRPNEFYLRFLKYDHAQPGEFLAKGHYDRGTCTIALSESAPGLRLGKNTQSLKEVEHSEGQAIFFPSLGFRHITSPEFIPTWHDVVQKERDMYSSDTSRWAIVFFADAVDLPSITYEEAHTPME